MLPPLAREARNNAVANRVGRCSHNHGNGGRGGFHSQNSWRASGHDQIYLESNQFGYEVREPLVAAISRAVFEK